MLLSAFFFEVHLVLLLLTFFKRPMLVDIHTHLTLPLADASPAPNNFPVSLKALPVFQPGHLSSLATFVQPQQSSLASLRVRKFSVQSQKIVLVL